MTTQFFRNRERVLLTALVAAFACSFALATTWIVDVNNGPGTNFTTISAAIAAAQPGDRILVRPGIYGETLVVNKGVTIVGWNATTYPMTVPADPFANAIWGGLAVMNIPAGQTCVISGLVIARPSNAGGASVGVLNSLGPVVLDRLIIPNGGLAISNATDVILQDVRVRHFPGASPPTAGVEIFNSWVQANDLDATGGDLGGEPGFHPGAGNALNVFGNAAVALARPKLIGGFGGGPWITSASTPAGGCAIQCVGSVVSIVDEPGSMSYIVGGQGGHRGAGSPISIPSGNGGNAIEAYSAGFVLNKLPMPVFAGPPGPNNAGGPLGSPGAPSFTTAGGVYAPIVDTPSLFKSIASSVPGGFWIFIHRAAGPLYPVALAVMSEFDLNLYPPSLQFAAGNPFNALALAVGTSDPLSGFAFGFGLPAYSQNVMGAAVVVQTADDVANTLFLSNPSVFVFGF